MGNAPSKEAFRDQPYSGYHKRDISPPDAELTQVGPGTAMGEYLRKFWTPVCLSVELTDVPKAIRILGENLVAFRDKAGKVGVLHRQCAHRGASLEFGIIQQQGIRCCYHGWVYDVDGRVLETPCEPAESNLKNTITQGAYPAFERHGLIFAYMGPIESKPDFPDFDVFHEPSDNRLIPFSNVYPCNWLQVAENIMDHFHSSVLHNNMVVESVDSKTASRLALEGFGAMPEIEWMTTHDGNGMCFTAARRIDDEKVYIRINSAVLPHHMIIGSPTAQASRTRHGRVGNNRWHTPVDDTHTIIFGWRHFNDEADPDHIGREEDLGVDKFDFIDGQVGNRTYDQGQRAPGDWEALTSIGPIAVHRREHLGRSDLGVAMYRKLLRAAVRGETKPNSIHEAQRAKGQGLHIYTQDSVLRVPKRAGTDDKQLLRKVAAQVFAIMQEADALPSAERDPHIRKRLDQLGEGHALVPKEKAAV